MIYKYNKNLKDYAKLLRNNMTKEEKHIWYDFLKKLPITVKRQKNIGSYIVDFFIPSKQLVIEIDGIQHGMDEAIKADETRDAYLNSLGITVLRYTNEAINKDFGAVCDYILSRIGICADDLK